ncbi:MAG: hypothetical protein ACRC2T_16285, partial [Thermoguttaceae bacterium]
ALSAKWETKTVQTAARREKSRFVQEEKAADWPPESLGYYVLFPVNSNASVLVMIPFRSLLCFMMRLTFGPVFGSAAMFRI